MVGRGKALSLWRTSRHVLTIAGPHRGTMKSFAPIECVQIGSAVLYHADARDLLAELSGIDVVLTDPVWPNCPAGLIVGSDDPLGLWRDAMDRLPALRRLVVILRSDSDPRFLRPVPKTLRFFNSIQLPYVMPHYLGRVLGGDELAYWFGSAIEFVPGRRVVPGRAPAAPAGAPAPERPPLQPGSDPYRLAIGLVQRCRRNRRRPFHGQWQHRRRRGAARPTLHRHRDRTALLRSGLSPH